MAKKTATKSSAKKTTAKPATKKVAEKKSAKPVAKAKVEPAKKVQAAKKTAVPASAAKSEKKSKADTATPTAMTKKGAAREEVAEKPIVKAQTIVSLIESDEAIEEPSKAEKVSKMKPVKVERGNSADEKAKWAELNRKYGKEKSSVYKMSEKYEASIPLQHKVLGWGFILSNDNDRLEVLFESGIRMLISNYKS